MNQRNNIKELLERYFASTSSDEDERRLRAYFASEHVADEWQPYRPIFEYITRRRRETEIPMRHLPRHGKRRIWWTAAAAACIAFAVWLPSRFAQQQPATCTGTFVIVDGHCSNDLELVKKYAIRNIDLIYEPSEEMYDPLDFLDDDFYQEQIKTLL